MLVIIMIIMRRRTTRRKVRIIVTKDVEQSVTLNVDRISVPNTSQILIRLHPLAKAMATSAWSTRGFGPHLTPSWTVPTTHWKWPSEKGKVRCSLHYAYLTQSFHVIVVN